jgi:glycyl-tRNA synthetase
LITKDSKKRYRADQLLEGRAEEYEKAGTPEKGKALLEAMAKAMTDDDMSGTSIDFG